MNKGRHILHLLYVCLLHNLLYQSIKWKANWRSIFAVLFFAFVLHLLGFDRCLIHLIHTDGVVVVLLRRHVQVLWHRHRRLLNNHHGDPGCKWDWESSGVGRCKIGCSVYVRQNLHYCRWQALTKCKHHRNYQTIYRANFTSNII